jgi:signal transduction histidine kinase
VVCVGDRPLDGDTAALAAAAREAILNAAKFAGAERIDVYAEASAERAEVFVRDRGAGFDPGAVPADRRGVRESIIGRMARHGGRAEVRSQPGGGTEVELVL